MQGKIDVEAQLENNSAKGMEIYMITYTYTHARICIFICLFLCVCIYICTKICYCEG